MILNLPTLPPVPCLDHGKPGSACKLDLKALGRRREELQRKSKLLRALLPSLEEEARKGWEPLHKNERGEPLRLLAACNELASVTFELRRLYATRAHHRGRVHEARRSNYKRGPKVVEARTLEEQAVEVAATWERLQRKAVLAAE